MSHRRAGSTRRALALVVWAGGVMLSQGSIESVVITASLVFVFLAVTFPEPRSVDDVFDRLFIQFRSGKADAPSHDRLGGAQVIVNLANRE